MIRLSTADNALNTMTNREGDTGKIDWSADEKEGRQTRKRRGERGQTGGPKRKRKYWRKDDERTGQKTLKRKRDLNDKGILF